MRSVKVDIAGETIDMPVNFASGEALAQAGLDPFVLTVRTRNGENMTAMEVIAVLHIGAKRAGSKLTRAEIGDAVFDEGVLKYWQTVHDYLGAFIFATPEHPSPKA